MIRLQHRFSPFFSSERRGDGLVESVASREASRTVCRTANCSKSTDGELSPLSSSDTVVCAIGVSEHGGGVSCLLALLLC